MPTDRSAQAGAKAAPRAKPRAQQQSKERCSEVTPLFQAPLSSRAIGVCTGMGCRTVGDIVDLYRSNGIGAFGQRRNCGKTTTESILKLVRLFVPDAEVSRRPAAGLEGKGSRRHPSRTRDLRESMKRLGISGRFPIELVRLPTRGITFCLDRGLSNVGKLVAHLGQRDYRDVFAGPFLGRKSLQEMANFLTALESANIAQLGRYLPVEPASRALSFAKGLEHALANVNPDHLDLMRRKFENGATYKELAQRCRRCENYVRLVELRFLNKLEKTLDWFAGERAVLWKAWESGGPLTQALSQQKVETAKWWLGGAIEFIFRKSEEGVRLRNQWEESFRRWAGELFDTPELSSSGVRLKAFLQKRTSANWACRFEPWLKERLGAALSFSAGHRVKRTAPGATAAEEALYRGQALARRWQEMYSRLKQFRARHGHANVPNVWKEDPELGHWVASQRHRRKAHHTSAEEIRLLDALHFAWQLRKRGTWEQRLEELSAFKARYGHCRVPADYPKNPKLGRYVIALRSMRKRGELPADRIAALEALGFEWSPRHQSTWPARYKDLLAYKKAHGHCQVPCTRGSACEGLGTWASVQRARYRRGLLSPERQRLLEKAGFQWKIKGGKRSRR